MTPLTNGQQPLYATAGSGSHQQIMGVVVIGGGGTPENGFGSEGFFLSGEEVEPTAFLSSGYDVQYHTAEGMTGPEGDYYAPQFSAAVRALLEAPCTVVFDVTFTDTDSGSKGYLLCDDGTTYLEVTISEFALYSDNEALLNDELGAPLVPGRYKMAFTRTEEAVSVSINGGTVVTDGADPLTPMTTVVLGCGGEGTVIHEFTILDPVADAGLPDLSTL